MLPCSLNDFLIECTLKPKARWAGEGHQQIVVVKAGKGAAGAALQAGGATASG